VSLPSLLVTAIRFSLVCFLAECIACSLIGYWHVAVVRLDVIMCIMAKKYILQQVSEQVNGKCPIGTQILQHSAPNTNSEHTQTMPHNDRMEVSNQNKTSVLNCK